MKKVQFNSESEFARLFNFNLQPYSIKAVNGIAVNVNTGSLIQNQLEVTRKHVSVTSYFPEKQDTSTYFFKAPFIVEY